MTAPRRWAGAARAVAVAAVGAALVLAADRVPGVVELAPVVAADAPVVASVRPVGSASLVCPGPETEGLSAVPSAGGYTAVLAATAPSSALRGVTAPSGAGRLQVLSSGTGEAVAATTDRATAIERAVSGAGAYQVSASGSLAPGAAAVQSWLQDAGDQRALVVTPCLAPRADLWLVGGGGQSTRRERIVLVNPGANTVTADVTVLGAGGELAVSGGTDVAVPARGRTVLLLDALVGAEATPVVHVTTSGGTLAAVLNDSWIDGAIGRGSDDAVPSAEPSTEQVIPAAALDGPAHLRVAVPGDDEAVVQARLLTSDGPKPLPRSSVVRVAGKHVVDIDLAGAVPGRDAVQVRADKPVVAGVMVERRVPAPTAQSDFTWGTSTAPVATVAGSPLPAGLGGMLTLVATGGPGAATVTTVDGAGKASSRSVTVPADSTVGVPVEGPGQVWVTPTSGTVRGAIDLFRREAAGAQVPGPLFTAYGLLSSAVTATQVPVRRVG